MFLCSYYVHTLTMSLNISVSLRLLWTYSLYVSQPLYISQHIYVSHLLLNILSRYACSTFLSVCTYSCAPVLTSFHSLFPFSCERLNCGQSLHRLDCKRQGRRARCIVCVRNDTSAQDEETMTCKLKLD